MERIFKTTVLLCVLAGICVLAQAQMAVPPPMPAYQPLSGAQLEQLLGPIALYPDPLIAQILAASTFPTEIVMADRYLSGGGDPNQIDQQPWDASVQALARYPDVLKWMDVNLTWTTELGQVFLYQQQDVMNAIQQLRAAAYSLGNLQSTPQQQVVNDGGYIEILPAAPQVIYVPVYQPSVVYYQRSYGIPLVTFGLGRPLGVWLDFDFDWHHHNLVAWSGHSRPADWWHERPDQRAAALASRASAWHPVNRPAPTAANWGDRGWGDNARGPRVIQSKTRPVQPRNSATGYPARPAPQPAVNRPAPTPVQRNEPVGRPAPNNAFIGIQNARDARNYSERGRQSMQKIDRPTPAPHPTAPPSGGSRGSGQKKH
ncbi:MAG: DUF3300 domain-containing protein [Candidatus Omnitrophica bacterium]|nr:DUF3300 domain-containing protein [Candidatus Omnitrophota bacterium]